MITTFLFVCSFIQAYWLYWLLKKSDEHAARLTRLETRQPVKHEPKAALVQAKQIFEKPIVKNAKEVKPLEIGDGRMRFDAEAQIAEWI
jgi:hypothetical protein